MNCLSLISVPPTHMRAVQPGLDYTVLHGLRAAIEAMSECTDIQQEHQKKNSIGETQTRMLNRGRIICITSARDNDSMKRLEEIVQTVLLQQNKAAAASDR